MKSALNAITLPRVSTCNHVEFAANESTTTVFFNKSDKLSPYISLPYRPKHPGWSLWLYALRSAFVQKPVPDTQGKQVDLAPWPERIEPSGIVRFKDTGRPESERMKQEIIKPDIVILCTGYNQSFPFFQTPRRRGHRAYPLPSEADVRGIWKRQEPTIGFIGFLRPSLGAIPPLAEMQTQLWILNLLAPHKIPRALVSEDEKHYRLHPLPDARIKYGVDHESYAYQLALDMNSAPGLTDIIGLLSLTHKSWRLLVIWALGAHFNTKFRLQGPWKWHGAQDLLVSTEFWETITRRPLFFGERNIPNCTTTFTQRPRSFCSFPTSDHDIWANERHRLPLRDLVGSGKATKSRLQGNSQSCASPQIPSASFSADGNRRQVNDCLSDQCKALFGKVRSARRVCMI